MSPKIIEILQESEARLIGLDSPRLSVEVLLAHVVGCSRLALVVDRDRVLSEQQVSRFDRLLSRRERGEPLAYILGEKEFYGLEFKVTPDVLIPRPETEHIVEDVESLFSSDASFRFADLGTGSGILAVTIASLFKQSTGVALDVSPGALAVALGNAKRHQVADRVEFLEADFLMPALDKEAFDLIVSNPPYVTDEEYAEASREVTAFEPATALVSGADGLDHMRGMVGHVVRALKSGGVFLMEIGYQQGQGVINFMETNFPELVDIHVTQDLAGLDRVVFARKL